MLKWQMIVLHKASWRMHIEVTNNEYSAPCVMQCTAAMHLTWAYICSHMSFVFTGMTNMVSSAWCQSSKACSFI